MVVEWLGSTYVRMYGLTRSGIASYCIGRVGWVVGWLADR